MDGPITFEGANKCTFEDNGLSIIYDVDLGTYSYKFSDGEEGTITVTDDNEIQLSYSPSEFKLNNVTVPNLYNGIYKADDGREEYICIFTTINNVNYAYQIIGSKNIQLLGSATLPDETEIVNTVLSEYASKGITVTGDGQIEYNGEPFSLLEAQNL